MQVGCLLAPGRSRVAVCWHRTWAGLPGLNRIVADSSHRLADHMHHAPGVASVVVWMVLQPVAAEPILLQLVVAVDQQTRHTSLGGHKDSHVEPGEEPGLDPVRFAWRLAKVELVVGIPVHEWESTYLLRRQDLCIS